MLTHRVFQLDLILIVLGTRFVAFVRIFSAVGQKEEVSAFPLKEKGLYRFWICLFRLIKAEFSSPAIVMCMGSNSLFNGI